MCLIDRETGWNRNSLVSEGRGVRLGPTPSPHPGGGRRDFLLGSGDRDLAPLPQQVLQLRLQGSQSNLTVIPWFRRRGRRARPRAEGAPSQGNAFYLLVGVCRHARRQQHARVGVLPLKSRAGRAPPRRLCVQWWFGGGGGGPPGRAPSPRSSPCSPSGCGPLAVEMVRQRPGAQLHGRK